MIKMDAIVNQLETLELLFFWIDDSPIGNGVLKGLLCTR